MKIQTISIVPNFNAQKSRTNINTQSNKRKKPMQDGLSTAGAWFGFGVGLDLLSRKLQFSKSPMKNSLAINGILGTGAGVVVGVQDQLGKKQDN